MTRPSDAAGITDDGLAGERTSLAWARMGLTLLGLASAILAASTGRAWIAFGAALLALALGLVVLWLSVRRRRGGPGMVQRGVVSLASLQVVATTAGALALAVAALEIIAQ